MSKRYDSPPPKPKEKTPQEKASILSAKASTTRKRSLTNGSLEELLQGNICVGEGHSYRSPKKFLIENAEIFKEQGFEVLFLEHVSPQYSFTSEEIGNAQSVLSKKLMRLDGGHGSSASGSGDYWQGFSFTEVVKTFFRAGIEIVPLEESEEKYHRDGESDKIRITNLNANALKVIEEKERAFSQSNGRDLKWLAFCGSMHLHTCLGVAGICDVTGALSIFVGDVGPDQSRRCEIYANPTDIQIGNSLARSEAAAAAETDRGSGEDIEKPIIQASVVVVLDPAERIKLGEIEFVNKIVCAEELDSERLALSSTSIFSPAAAASDLSEEELAPAVVAEEKGLWGETRKKLFDDVDDDKSSHIDGRTTRVGLLTEQERDIKRGPASKIKKPKASQDLARTNQNKGI